MKFLRKIFEKIKKWTDNRKTKKRIKDMKEKSFGNVVVINGIYLKLMIIFEKLVKKYGE